MSCESPFESEPPAKPGVEEAPEGLSTRQPRKRRCAAYSAARITRPAARERATLLSFYLPSSFFITSRFARSLKRKIFILPGQAGSCDIAKAYNGRKRGNPFRVPRFLLSSAFLFTARNRPGPLWPCKINRKTFHASVRNRPATKGRESPAAGRYHGKNRPEHRSHVSRSV